MKRQWHVSRTTTSHPNAQHRWDHAYHLLLRWALPSQRNVALTPHRVLPVKQEETNASSCVCPGVDVPSSPSSDD